VLKLVRSAALVAIDVLVTLKMVNDSNDTANVTNTLNHLDKISGCPTFALYFVEAQVSYQIFTWRKTSMEKLAGILESQVLPNKQKNDDP